MKAESTILDALENMARQHCHTDKVERDYNGQVAGTFVTDSGGISTDAEALEILAASNPSRFRIVAQGGRMVVGYWPENDPLLPPNKKPRNAGGGDIAGDEDKQNARGLPAPLAEDTRKEKS